MKRMDEPGNTLPQARVQRRHWQFPWIWVVPVVAALVAGYLVWNRVRDLGPTITIRFQDGSGLVPGRTDIRYRGVTVGEVKEVEVSEDRQSILVKARLKRSAASFAQAGSVFWTVRLQSGIENLANVGTVFSGAYIEVRPGEGEKRTEFVGLDRAPAGWDKDGLKLVLRAPRAAALWSHAPVHYRGAEVGSVQDIRLAPDATLVDIHVVIEARYAALVGKDSRFWQERPVEVDFGLLRGLKLHLPPLKTLASGGISFATPEAPKGAPVGDGTVFPLHNQPNPGWLAWAPRIAIPPEIPEGAGGGEEKRMTEPRPSG